MSVSFSHDYKIHPDFPFHFSNRSMKNILILFCYEQDNQI